MRVVLSLALLLAAAYVATASAPRGSAPAPTPVTLTKWNLFDADKYTLIQPLTGGEQLNTWIIYERLNILTEWSGPVAAVRYGYNGNANYNTEYVTPYAIGGDEPGGRLFYWRYSEGPQVVTATPLDASGNAIGPTATWTGSIYDRRPPAVQRLQLVGAASCGNKVFDSEITANDIFDLRGYLPCKEFNILIDTNVASDLSVAVNFDGVTRTEVVAPYLVGGDTNGQNFALPLTAGDHVVSVLPYYGTGPVPTNMGPPFTVNFSVASCARVGCASVAPVCGEDGKTYENACLAQCAGVVYAPGRSCPFPST